VSVTYTAVLDVSEDSVLFLSGLLHAERIRRGTRTADARRARGPGASRRPRGTARGPGPSPQIVTKRQRRLSGIEKIVLSLTATA